MIISVFGSTGSGKSLISLLIANKQKNVCVISFDRLTPMLNVYMPFMQFSGKNSLGSLLQENITIDTLKDKILISKDNKNICFLGFAPEETVASYPEKIPLHKINDIIELLSKSINIECFVFDLTSNVYQDNSVIYILKNSDVAYYVLNPTTSSLAFLDSHKEVLSDVKFEYILNDCHRYSPTSTVAKERKIEHIVPHSKELLEAYLTSDFKHFDYSFMEILGGNDAQ